MHQVNRCVITTSRLTQVSHRSVEGQSDELWESPTYRTPKVTCSRVQRPETKKMLLMRWLWVRLSYWRHSLSERMRGIETVAPNAVRRCCKVKEKSGGSGGGMEEKHKWPKNTRNTNDPKLFHCFHKFRAGRSRLTWSAKKIQRYQGGASVTR